MRAAVGLLLLLAPPLAAAQLPEDPEPVHDARAQSAPVEPEPRSPALALLLGVVAAGALALVPRRE